MGGIFLFVYVSISDILVLDGQFKAELLTLSYMKPYCFILRFSPRLFLKLSRTVTQSFMYCLNCMMYSSPEKDL